MTGTHPGEQRGGVAHTFFGGRMASLHQAHHLATLTYDGRFWDVYFELEDPVSTADPARGRLVFSAGDRAEGEPPLRTTAIFVEDTPEAALARARELRDHQLVGLLRSCLP
ncbi:MAG: hypothetical protein ACRELD_05510 [Longimicrobiales bacterium]